MCGRYVRRSDKQRIAEAFRTGEISENIPLPPDYNVAPTTFQPVIRESRESRDRELVLMRWGLVPYFAKSLADVKGISTINARAESIDPKTKQPFSFMLRDEAPFAFAGLWDAWKEPDGGWLQSFSIVTTDANELMAPIHTRMPVILHPRDYRRWLSREVTEQPPVDLLRPFDSDAMKASVCNPLVGNVRNNGPEMLNSA